VLQQLIAQTTAGCVSFFLRLLAYWFGNLQEQTLGGRPLPAISVPFYSESAFVFWWPIPLCVCVVATVLSRKQPEHSLLFCVSAVGLTMVFIVVFCFAVALPFLPMKIYPLFP
jgi:hypothetical protein